jgi:hypothetical protein
VRRSHSHQPAEGANQRAARPRRVMADLPSPSNHTHNHRPRAVRQITPRTTAASSIESEHPGTGGHILTVNQQPGLDTWPLCVATEFLWDQCRLRRRGRGELYRPSRLPAVLARSGPAGVRGHQLLAVPAAGGRIGGTVSSTLAVHAGTGSEGALLGASVDRPRRGSPIETAAGWPAASRYRRPDEISGRDEAEPPDQTEAVAGPSIGPAWETL